MCYINDFVYYTEKQIILKLEFVEEMHRLDRLFQTNLRRAEV